MPIKVTCECDQTFAVKDEMAGQTMKCPKCGQPVEIPAPEPQLPPQPVARPAAPAGLSSLLEEEGVVKKSKAGPKCPSCGAELQPNAILCVECGLNLQTGEKLRPEGIEEPGQGKKMSEAEKLVAKAAKEIEAMPIETTDYGEGLAAYLFTGGLILATIIALALGGVFMYFVNTVVFPEGKEQTFSGTAAFSLCTFGTVIIFLAYIDVAGQAFNEKIWHGVAMLAFPLYGIAYAMMRALKLMRPILMGLVGLDLIILGAAIYLESLRETYTAGPGCILYGSILVVFVDLWFVAKSRIVGMAFDEENGVLHGCLSMLVPLYCYVYSFLQGKRYIGWAIFGMISGILMIVFLVLFWMRIPQPPAPEVEDAGEALLGLFRTLA